MRNRSHPKYKIINELSVNYFNDLYREMGKLESGIDKLE